VSDQTGYGAATRERPAPDDRPIGEVFSAVTADLSTLIRQEVALAKAEVRQSATQAGAAAGKLAGAGVAGHMVLLFVSISAWWGLGQFIGNAWSALVVAAFWAVVGAVLYTSGRSQLGQVEGLPLTTETTKQIPPALAGHEETS
jgi:outer membrane lipoprotein SlyB